MNAASVKPLPFEMNSQPLLSKLCVKNNVSMQWTITSIQSHQTINCESITVKVNCLEMGPFVRSALTCWLLHCFSTLRFFFVFWNIQPFTSLLFSESFTSLLHFLCIGVCVCVCFLSLQIEQMSNNRLLKKDGIAPVATGNWGCGSSSRGNVQLKLVIQWMAASLAGLPVLVYYTSGNDKLTKVKPAGSTPFSLMQIQMNSLIRKFFINFTVRYRLSCFIGSKMDRW